ncbi:MAG: hypothetical protein M3211_10755, partial [Actinomycetota bacterium]|nr:hypothetical protein [Actinomycetota bacterium]
MRAARRGLVTAASVLLLGALLPPALAAPGPERPDGSFDSPTPKPSDDDRVGRWRVAPGSTAGTFALTWRSPDRLPVTDARPEFFAGAQSLGSPRLSADGRTLRLTLASAQTPDTDALSVVLSGRVLDEPAPRVGLRTTAPRAVRVAARALGTRDVAAPAPGP